MSEATVRASIKTLVSGVANAGEVYDLEPFADTWDGFLDRFKTNIGGSFVIRGWSISCEAVARQGQVASGVRNTANVSQYEYRVRGYQSFDYENATEKTFLTLALAVMDALDSGIVSGGIFNANLAQLTAYEPRTFGGVLCHYAEIQQTVWEQI